MNEETTEELVNTYLKRVKKNFPGWLEKKKEKQEEILSRIEERIWDTAKDLSENEQVTASNIRASLLQLGTPRSVLKEYSQRGTPKIYITEEWWPYYKKWMSAAFVVVVLFHVTSFLYNIFKGRITLVMPLNIYIHLLMVFFVVTIVFMAISVEGYLPKDFNLQPEQPPTRKAQEGVTLPKKERKLLKPIVDPKEEIIEGIFAFLFAGVLIFLPLSWIGRLIHPDFVFILRIGSLLLLVGGTNSVLRGILGNEAVTGQQISLIITAVLRLATIPLLFLILRHPEIFPIIYYNTNVGIWNSLKIPPKFYQVFRNIFAVFIALHLIAAIYTVYQVGTMEKYKIVRDIA